MYGPSEEHVERRGTDSTSGLFGKRRATFLGDSVDNYSWTNPEKARALVASVQNRPQKTPTKLEEAELLASVNRQLSDLAVDTGLKVKFRQQAQAAEAAAEKYRNKISSSGGNGRGIRIPRNTKIAPADFMALVAIVAQKQAGKDGTPTATQVATAEKIVRQKLSAAGSSVAGGEPAETMRTIKCRLLANQMAGNSDDAGAFWNHVKDVAKKTAPIVLPAAAVAFPVAALTASAVAKAQQKKDASSEGPASSTGWSFFSSSLPKDPKASAARTEADLATQAARKAGQKADVKKAQAKNAAKMADLEEEKRKLDSKLSSLS